MLNCYGLYPAQSVIVKYGSRKMSGSQVVLCNKIRFESSLSEKHFYKNIMIIQTEYGLSKLRVNQKYFDYNEK